MLVHQQLGWTGWQRSRHVTRCLVGGLLWAASLSPAEAAEYYSWIDPSGTAVLTDNPSQIPPASERSAVSVHRYLEVAPSSPSWRHTTDPASFGVAGQGHSGMPAGISRMSALDPADIEVPDALLAPPQDDLQSNYLWVPLQTPLFLRTRHISGFWWRPGRTSPVDALNAALLQLAGPTDRAYWGRGRPRARIMTGGNAVSSGNPVYDQVVRERHSLQQAATQSPFAGHRSMGSVTSSSNKHAGYSGRASVR